MNDKHSPRVPPSVLRVQGPEGKRRSVRVEVRQTQWLRALFAYVELHADPSFEVRAELEPARTVPAVRWRCHRDLLQAHASLVAQLPRPIVRGFRDAVSELVRAGVSYEQVETELGEFQALDAAHILSNCPFLWRSELGSTYWSGEGAASSSDEATTQPSIHVALAACQALGPRNPQVPGPVCISIGANAPAEFLESDGIWVSVTDLRFSARVQPLEDPDQSGYLSVSNPDLIESLPLVGGRVAWAVAVRIEEAPRNPSDASAALAASLELVRALSVSSETRVPSWHQSGAAPRVMAVTEFARDTAVAVLSVFESLQRCFFRERVPPNRDRYVFDSKHFHALSSDGINKTLSISGSSYRVSLQVEIDEEALPAPVPSTGDLRSSTVRLRAGRRRIAKKHSV